MPDYGKFWKNVFDDKKDPKLATLNKKIRVDWNRWQDEDHDKDMQEDFDPDKLIELMKRNGEWSDEEDGQGPGIEDQLPEEGDGEEEGKQDEDENGRARDELDQAGDDHMFEQFLKSGDYASVGTSKKRRRMENPEDDADDEDDDL